MSIRILSGERINECDRPGACLYEKTSGIAFGPVFADEHEAQDFIDFCMGEYRRVPVESMDMALVAWRHDRKAVEA